MTKDKERDDALIAEAISGFPGNAFTAQMLAQAVLRLERSGWQPKPDRAEVLFDDLYGKTKDEQIDCFRRHFAELRAEWEAERQDEPVCLIGKVDCDGNELVTVSKDALDRYKDQARYTYQRAEKAEARVKKLEAERPAVVVPDEVRRVVWETARDALSKNWLPVYDWIKSLDGAKGGE